MAVSMRAAVLLCIALGAGALRLELAPPSAAAAGPQPLDTDPGAPLGLASLQQAAPPYQLLPPSGRRSLQRHLHPTPPVTAQLVAAALRRFLAIYFWWVQGRGACCHSRCRQ